MPELPDVEAYRVLAERGLGRRIATLEVRDPHCLVATTSEKRLVAELAGERLVAARRRGKLLLLDSTGPTLGLHFGMTGSLVVDGAEVHAPSSVEDEERAERWLRLVVGFCDGGSLAMRDPRRLGRVQLDPEEWRLGPDAATVSLAELRRALEPRRPPGPALKARLLDQTKLAGVGNLVADEVLWRAGLSPLRPCGSLDDGELRRLQRILRGTLRRLVQGGGSHLGEVVAERHREGRCPKDGSALERGTVGGRTTWWCPAHQR